MRSGVENPFQNAPGPFIYALPNLAGPRLSLPSITIADCSLDNCPGPAPPSDGHDSYHNRAATSLNLPVESADSLPKDVDPELSFVPQSPLITFDENDDTSDSDDTQQREQQQERSCSGSSTPTPSQTSSGTGFAGSESSGEKDDDDDGSEGSPKEKGKRRRRSGQGARRRRRNRQRSEQGGCAMGPRVMGIPGIHHHLPLWWIQHSLPQPSPSLPGAMAGVVSPSHAQASSWYPGPGGGYHGYAVNTSGPTFLVLAAPVPGLFGLPAS